MVEKEKSKRKLKWKFNVEIIPFDIKTIYIWTFLAVLSIEQVPKLAKRVAYQR